MSGTPGVGAGAPRAGPVTLVCVGHCALDRVFGVPAWPAGSAKIAASRYEEAGGGMAANAAVAAVRLGARVRFWGPTGQDATGAFVAAQLAADGVDVSGLHAFEGLTTSTSAVLVDDRGERLVVGYRGTALQAPADWLPVSRLRDAGALLADVRWPAGAAAALEAARASGVPAILDGEVALRGILDDLVGRADHVVFSEKGLEAFSGEDADAGLREAIARGATVAAVTLGERGVRWIEARAPHTVQVLPAFAVDVVDTLAAGDVFHGAYAVAIAERRGIADAMRFASAAAALKCTLSGGRKGAPSREAVEHFLARNA
jgi:sulfofructose kinase